MFDVDAVRLIVDLVSAFRFSVLLIKLDLEAAFSPILTISGTPRTGGLPRFIRKELDEQLKGSKRL